MNNTITTQLFYEAIKQDLPQPLLKDFSTFVISLQDKHSPVEIHNVLSEIEQMLSSLTHENIDTWIVIQDSGLCNNLNYNIKTPRLSLRTLDIYSIISSLSFLLYENTQPDVFSYETKNNKSLSNPIPRVTGRKWIGEELNMRILFAHWLSRQLKLYFTLISN